MNLIAIIDPGYVGLPFALEFTKSGAKVLGLDIDPKKTDAINGGKRYIRHVASADIGARRDEGLWEAATDFSRISEADPGILCVPTPLNRFREPDLSHVLDTAETIAPDLKKGTLVVLEFTTCPGAMDGELREAFEAGSGLKAGVDFHLTVSPALRPTKYFKA